MKVILRFPLGAECGVALEPGEAIPVVGGRITVAGAELVVHATETWCDPPGVTHTHVLHARYLTDDEARR